MKVDIIRTERVEQKRSRIDRSPIISPKSFLAKIHLPIKFDNLTGIESKALIQGLSCHKKRNQPIATHTSKLTMRLFITLAILATTAAQSTDLRTQHRNLLHTLGLRSLQSYTSSQCADIISSMTSADEDGSGGLSQDEYYSFLSSMDGVGNAGSYSELELMLKVSHKSLACYCTVLGDGEDCCVGEGAEVPLSVLENDDEVSAQYEAEVCETMSWALGMEGDEVEDTTTTEATTTDATVEAGSTAATATAGSTSTPDAGELPVTTEVPVGDCQPLSHYFHFHLHFQQL